MVDLFQFGSADCIDSADGFHSRNWNATVDPMFLFPGG